MRESIYEQIGANYRFFLGWRHASFVGDLAAVYAALSLSAAMLEKKLNLVGLVPILAACVPVLLFFSERVIRNLYGDAVRAGMSLEQAEGVQGFYTLVHKRMLPPGECEFKKITHAAVLDFLYVASAAGMVVYGVFLFL